MLLQPMQKAMLGISVFSCHKIELNLNPAFCSLNYGKMSNKSEILE
jgi:hypothetical protein